MKDFDLNFRVFGQNDTFFLEKSKFLEFSRCFKEALRAVLQCGVPLILYIDGIFEKNDIWQVSCFSRDFWIWPKILWFYIDSELWVLHFWWSGIFIKGRFGATVHQILQTMRRLSHLKWDSEVCCWRGKGIKIEHRKIRTFDDLEFS